MPDNAHPVAILAADDRGTPLAARCDTCRRQWSRPEDDFGADTLTWWARHHHES